MSKEKSTRVRLLEEGAALTSGDRDEVYGDPNVNLACFDALVRVWYTYTRKNHRYPTNYGAHNGAMLNVLSKISRIACGKAHEDNYRDGATYFAIAGEAAARWFAQSATLGKVTDTAATLSKDQPEPTLAPDRGCQHPREQTVIVAHGSAADVYCGVCKEALVHGVQLVPGIKSMTVAELRGAKKAMLHGPRYGATTLSEAFVAKKKSRAKQPARAARRAR